VVAAEAVSVAAAANSRWLASAMLAVLSDCAGGITAMGSPPPEEKHAAAVSDASATQAKRPDSPQAFFLVLMG
jgi:hypothetical protein